MRTLDTRELDLVSGGIFGSIAEAVRGQAALIKKISRRRGGRSFKSRVREAVRRAKRSLRGRVREVARR